MVFLYVAPASVRQQLVASPLVTERVCPPFSRELSAGSVRFRVGGRRLVRRERDSIPVIVLLAITGK